MRRRTIWALFALTSAGVAVYGVQREPSAVAAMQEEADAGGGSSAEPLGTPGADAGAPREAPGQPGAAEGEETSREGIQKEACPTTAAAKVNMVLRELHVINQAEIASSRLASERAQATEVKDFAQSMIRDHSEADRKLTEYAKKSGLDLTKVAPVDPIHAALDRANEATDKALRESRGPAFEAAYIGAGISQHRVSLSAVADARKYAKDEAKALLDDMYRMLGDHLARAEKLGEQLRFEPLAVGGGPGEKGGSEGEANPGWQGDAGSQGAGDAAAPKVRPPPVDGREESNE